RRSSTGRNRSPTFSTRPSTSSRCLLAATVLRYRAVDGRAWRCKGPVSSLTTESTLWAGNQRAPCESAEVIHKLFHRSDANVSAILGAHLRPADVFLGCHRPVGVCSPPKRAKPQLGESSSANRGFAITLFATARSSQAVL